MTPAAILGHFDDATLEIPRSVSPATDINAILALKFAKRKLEN